MVDSGERVKLKPSNEYYELLSQCAAIKNIIGDPDKQRSTFKALRWAHNKLSKFTYGTVTAYTRLHDLRAYESEAEGNFDEAEQQLQRSLKFRMEDAGADDWEIFWTLSNLALLSLSSGRHERAADFKLDATAMAREQPESPYRQMVISWLKFTTALNPYDSSMTEKAGEILEQSRGELESSPSSLEAVLKPNAGWYHLVL
ncbi:hypothetical protein MMC11_008098 [Xylographa trunciseda]|nr:hypothetical protein [Xylographa trunciseda]